MDPYEALANAVVEQAVKDYRTARRKLKRDPSDDRAREEIVSIEKFFHSKRFTLFTLVDPDYILRMLKEEKL